MAQGSKDREKYPGLFCWLDQYFDPGNENEYQQGEVIHQLNEGLGEGYSPVRDKVLSPRYRLSKSQLNRYVAHFYTASGRFMGNPQLRTLLFSRWPCG